MTRSPNRHDLRTDHATDPAAAAIEERGIAEEEGHENGRTDWMRLGLKDAMSIPGLILTGSILGLAAIGREAGFGAGEMMFMTGAVWAVPSILVLVAAKTSATGLVAAMVAVTLSAIRFVPLTATLVAPMRRGRRSDVILYFLSHFVVVTSWVTALSRFPNLAREARLPYFAVLGGTLLATQVVVTGLYYAFASSLPPIVTASLYFLTPLYFIMGTWSSSPQLSARGALILGLVLGPILHPILGGADLLVIGAIGGFAAFILHRRGPKGGTSS